VNKEGNPLMDQNDKPQLKMPNPRAELSCTCLMAWHTLPIIDDSVIDVLPAHKIQNFRT